MSATLAIVIYSCLASAPLDDFDPHRVDAAAHYVSIHPDVCREEPPIALDAALSPEQCQTRAMMDVMPGWSEQNRDRVWIGAKCTAQLPVDGGKGGATGPNGAPAKP